MNTEFEDQLDAVSDDISVPEVIDPEAEVSPMEDLREEMSIGDGVDPVAALLSVDPDQAPTATVPIKRLNTVFTVQAIMDDREYDKLVERCSTFVRNRRGGGRNREIDGRRLSKLTIAEYTVNPGFKPGRPGYEKLAEKFGSQEPEILVARALLVGEQDLLTDKILTLSGFEDDLELAGN